jgi:hypothetical protein
MSNVEAIVRSCAVSSNLLNKIASTPLRVSSLAYCFFLIIAVIEISFAFRFSEAMIWVRTEPPLRECEYPIARAIRRKRGFDIYKPGCTSDKNFSRHNFDS